MASDEVSLKEYLPQLFALREDETLPLYQTNLVFLVPRLENDQIEKIYIYSILDKRPKRAKVYWFVNVEVTDDPFTKAFSMNMMDTDYMVRVKFYLGFRVPQDVNVYLRQVIHDLMKQGRLPKQPQKYSLTPGRQVGDFQFVLIEEEMSKGTVLKKWDREVMQIKLAIKRITTSPERWFGLEYSDVRHEMVPLMIGKTRKTHLIEITELPEENF
jgi:KUP system potassium uptake protein